MVSSQKANPHIQNIASMLFVLSLGELNFKWDWGRMCRSGSSNREMTDVDAKRSRLACCTSLTNTNNCINGSTCYAPTNETNY